jgi:hypothetical protein
MSLRNGRTPPIAGRSCFTTEYQNPWPRRPRRGGGDCCPADRKRQRLFNLSTQDRKACSLGGAWPLPCLAIGTQDSRRNRAFLQWPGP